MTVVMPYWKQTEGSLFSDTKSRPFHFNRIGWCSIILKMTSKLQ